MSVGSSMVKGWKRSLKWNLLEKFDRHVQIYFPLFVVGGRKSLFVAIKCFPMRYGQSICIVKCWLMLYFVFRDAECFLLEKSPEKR